MPKIPSHLLNLAGEYRVCSELQKRGIFATITYGQHKSVDVLAVNEIRRRMLRIEIKTSQLPRFVTKIFQKGLQKSSEAPDFWVLVLLQRNDDEKFTERFFILSHKKICSLQKQVNRASAHRYKKRHGELPDQKLGVDCLKLSVVEPYENNWQALLRRLKVEIE